MHDIWPLYPIEGCILESSLVHAEVPKKCGTHRIIQEDLKPESSTELHALTTYAPLHAFADSWWAVHFETMCMPFCDVAPSYPGLIRYQSSRTMVSCIEIKMCLETHSFLFSWTIKNDRDLSQICPNLLVPSNWKARTLQTPSSLQDQPIWEEQILAVAAQNRIASVQWWDALVQKLRIFLWRSRCTGNGGSTNYVQCSSKALYDTDLCVLWSLILCCETWKFPCMCTCMLPWVHAKLLWP